MSADFVTIYGLYEPDGETLRYIGKTILTPRKRFVAHLSEARTKKKSNHKNHWIRSLTARDELPVITVLAVVPEEGWEDIERWLITEARRLGIALTNNAVGGEGGSGFRHTEQTKARMSQERKARGLRPPPNQGPLSEETKAKIGAANRGKTRSPEFRAAISERQRGSTHSDEHRAKIAAGNRGKRRTAEQRVRMSAAAKERANRPEEVERVRTRMLNRVVKLTPVDVVIIRERLAAGDRQIDIAADFGVRDSLISRIKTGQRHPVAA